MRASVVLMYHRIGDGGIGGEPGEPIYAVQRDAFLAQIHQLHDAGHEIVELHDLAAAPASTRPGPVVLTFDDGNRSDAEVAAPALARLRLRATFFVTPAWIGRPGFMDWSDVRELARLGMTVGAHGLDHTPLNSLEYPQLRVHLREARREIEARLRSAPMALSMPRGAGGRRELRAAREEGFRFVAGSIPRRYWPGNAEAVIPRFAVRRSDSAAFVRALAAQRPPALLRALGRHALLQVLRRALGTGLYEELRTRWSQPERP